MTHFLSSRAIYETVIRDAVPQARERLWIATADIKDMYVEAGGRDMVPFLAVLDRMRKRGVGIRIIQQRSRGRTGARTSTAIPDCGMAGAANTAETAVVGSIAATRWCDTKLTTAARI